MSESRSADMPAALRVAAGADREGCQRGLGISTVAFKVTMPNPSGLFILENTFLAKGGPARHLHYDQEEWFYILEGEFQFEVGTQRLHLHPGDSLLAPRQVPHVWAFVGEARGRILIAFLPAGNVDSASKGYMCFTEPRYRVNNLITHILDNLLCSTRRSYMILNIL